jgi:ABC-type sugar transport system ATPase subunit
MDPFLALSSPADRLILMDEPGAVLGVQHVNVIIRCRVHHVLEEETG